MDVSWQDCMVKCRADVNCVVVYRLSDIQCQYFSFGSIRLSRQPNISTIQQAKSENDEIVLKIPTQVQCPTSNPLIPGPTYYTQLTNNQFYLTTVSPDSLYNNIYNLTYSVSTCPNNTKMFQRGETTVVCIGLYFFEAPRCNNQAAASALCKAQNGTLTGPANANEYEYIQDISNSSKYTSNPDSIQWLVYWIDGVQHTSIAYQYTFEDSTHNGITNYNWTPGSPHLTGPGICIYSPGPNYGNVQVYPCTDSYLSYLVCWRGALCQVPPIIELF
ncbi:hypothetical protein L3Y34_019339 [Caenorhabditis briggsae]|uniref:PAN-3 domain-containing protein n=1 Tax=Caenorhabditis briggsae TaxID=6238 RepID=A0AAE9DNE7_CAEBR|nr:hypothetical protein L3Y34_019334 [Caenorhabditis briggsae]ULU08166.1 hypothetical protein L3Y34_019339 [Caenorhabditis briggsae]